MEWLATLPHKLWEVYIEIAPYIALGLFFAGLLHAFVSRRIVARWLGGGQHSFRSIFYATLIGVPLPLCSCGVIPTAMALKRHGASPGAVTAFLIATPQTSTDAVIATFGVLGPFYGTIRVIAAFITGIAGGLLVQGFGGAKAEADPSAEPVADEELPKKWKQRIVSIFHYGFVEMLGSLSMPLLFGIVAAGLMNAFLPADFFSDLNVDPWMQMVVVAAVSIPFYICSAAAVPIGALLLVKGLAPGAVFVFLTAGPVTNIASLVLIRSIFGKRQLLLFLATVFASAMLFGAVVEWGLPHFPSTPTVAASGDHCSPWSLKGIAAILFVIPFAYAIVRKIMARFTPNTPNCDGGSCCGSKETP